MCAMRQEPSFRYYIRVITNPLISNPLPSNNNNRSGSGDPVLGIGSPASVDVGVGSTVIVGAIVADGVASPST